MLPCTIRFSPQSHGPRGCPSHLLLPPLRNTYPLGTLWGLPLLAPPLALPLHPRPRRWRPHRCSQTISRMWTSRPLCFPRPRLPLPARLAQPNGLVAQSQTASIASSACRGNRCDATSRAATCRLVRPSRNRHFGTSTLPSVPHAATFTLLVDLASSVPIGVNDVCLTTRDIRAPSLALRARLHPPLRVPPWIRLAHLSARPSRMFSKGRCLLFVTYPPPHATSWRNVLATSSADSQNAPRGSCCTASRPFRSLS